MMAFPPQGGMPQHSGMPHGQPMAGGVPHPQAMGGPMQMPPGVSGPHGQQVSQAGPMMGMQPGMGMPGGPSAHAMSHLAPNGQMMQQPGMQQHAMNPQMMNQAHQQRLFNLQRQQMLRNQMAQQGPPFNPQQLAAMQQGQLANMPPQMQNQMHMAAHAQMAQQQAMQEAARAQHNQNMAAQHAQHMAMQQAGSQGSHQGHPSSQPGQPNQPPMRPASAMGGGTTGMEARPSPAATAGPQGGPQPVPQSQPPNQPNHQPTTSGPGPQSQPATSQPQQPNPGQNNPQTAGQGAQNQAQGQNRPNAQQMNPNAMQAMMRPQQAAAAAAQQRANGTTLLQAFNFANKLGSFKPADRSQNTLQYWQNFVQSHFTDDAIYRMVLKFSQDNASKAFEVHATGLARFFHTQFDTDIEQIQLLLDGNQEKKLNENHFVVQADKSRMLHWYRDGTQLVWNGIFRVIYAGDKIEHLSFEMQDHQIYLPRTKLDELCVQVSPHQNRSPKATKTQGKQRNQQQPTEPAFDLRRLPPTKISDLGIHMRTQGYLELSETMNLMQPIVHFSKEHPEFTVNQALAELVKTYSSAPQQAPGAAGAPGQQIQSVFPPGGLQGRNPSMQMQMQSPAMSNSGLPNGMGPGGHTPSPHQSNMAPPMAPQLSQQGSVASGGVGSSNTSPNVGGAGGAKRRRSTAAGVKDENEVNGAGGKVKQSPRMASGNNKRLKGS